MAADEEGYSDNEYEVETGYLTHTDPSGRTRRLGPGDRFRPTKKQEREGSLQGKASLAEAASPTPRSTGADIGLRAIPMSQKALEEALEAGLEEEHFERLEPEGADGETYLVSQVRDLIEEREEAAGHVERDGRVFEEEVDADLAEQELEDLSYLDEVEPTGGTEHFPAYAFTDVSDAIRLEGEAQDAEDLSEGEGEGEDPSADSEDDEEDEAGDEEE